ncbi:MAG: type II toxin-antitoxin system HicB family antitoxin [Gammaproteobacteria bacterium]|nr:type II toxin-antitoxin system HicB family antitoxin [Gammaproteobacteria bacterium]
MNTPCKKVLFYKNYNARIRYSAEDGFLVGHIMGVRDIVGFHGRSAREIEAAFHEAVDDYLDLCARLGKPPQKPRHRVPVSARAFATAQAAAARKGVDVERWVSATLRRAAESR